MDKLNDLLNQIKNLALEIASRNFITDITELQEKLQHERLYIVVLGLFKRGKSSLINAVLGKELLPVAVTPVTAIVTLLEFTSGESFSDIQFKDGHHEKKTLSEIRFYVSEEENPANKKRVEVVRIYDSASLLQLVSLVDTPGLGSTFEHNTAATLQFVPKIDAAIFVLSADMPVSKADIDFLSEIKDVVPKILFVINKIDLLSQADLQKIIVHNIKIISKELQRAIDENDLFLVSVRQPGLGIRGSGIELLKRSIQDIATHEKNILLQQSVKRQYRRLYDELQMQLQLKLDTIVMPLHELEQKQEQLKDSISLMRSQKDEFQSIIDRKIHLLQEQIHNVMNEESHFLKTTVQQKLSEADKSVLQNGQSDKLQSGLNQFILSRFEQTKEKLEQATREQFKNLLQQYSNRSQSFLNELAGHLKSLMGISFDMVAGKFDLDVYTSFYLTLDSGMGNIKVFHSIFNRLQSKSAQRRRLLKKLQQNYDAIVVRNTSSIIYDLQYKIQESFRKFNYDLNNRLKELLESIETIIAETINAKNKKEYLLEKDVANVKERLKMLHSMSLADNEENKLAPLL